MVASGWWEAAGERRWVDDQLIARASDEKNFISHFCSENRKVKKFYFLFIFQTYF